MLVFTWSERFHFLLSESYSFKASPPSHLPFLISHFLVSWFIWASPHTPIALHTQTKQIVIILGHAYHWQFYMDSIWGALLRSERPYLYIPISPGRKGVSSRISLPNDPTPSVPTLPVPSCLLLMNGSEMATVHLTSQMESGWTFVLQLRPNSKKGWLEE